MDLLLSHALSLIYHWVQDVGKLMPTGIIDFFFFFAYICEQLEFPPLSWLKDD